MITTFTVGTAIWTAQINGAPNHSIQIVLPEQLAGRRIVDAWEPMPVPPTPSRVLSLVGEFEPVAKVEDDIGTGYDVPSGGYGGDEEEIAGDRDVFPAPPTHARELTITVVDIVQGAESIERGHVTVALADGSS